MAAKVRIKVLIDRKLIVKKQKEKKFFCFLCLHLPLPIPHTDNRDDHIEGIE